MEYKMENLYCRQNPINAETTLTGIIGADTGHSVTPILYDDVFAQLGLNIVYLCMNVQPDGLEDALKGLLALGVRAAYITMPYKRSVLPLLHDVDPLARAMGSVNLIVNQNNRFKGYNVDIHGFMHPLQSLNIAGEKTLLLGAGGVGTACAFGLAKLGTRITILDIHPERAKILADKLYDQQYTAVGWDAFSEETLCQEMANANILVNATDVGYGEKEGQSPVPAQLLRHDMIVYDIVNAYQTPLTQDARAVGAYTLDGNDMVAYSTKLFIEALTGTQQPDTIVNIARKAGEKAQLYQVRHR